MYEARGPIGNAETFRNALKAMDEVNSEILQSIRTVWDRQAASSKTSELEAA
jgi:hypothetical protein